MKIHIVLKYKEGQKWKKIKIISLSTTLLYSFVLVISFLCFYHSIVESSWLLEIIVSLFVLIGVNLLSYKTKTKELFFL